MIYLPYRDTSVSVQCFDEATLNLQIDNIVNLLENYQDTEFAKPVDDRLKAAWRGYEVQLCWYGLQHCERLEELNRSSVARARLDWHLEMVTSAEFSMDLPGWTNNEEILLSHRSQLVAMNPRYYSEVFVGVPDDLEVVWPDAAD